MATISRSGITTAQPIQATHITNIIDALDGTSATTVVATGSFSGSFIGTIIATGSLFGSASWATNAVNAINATSATTASSVVFANITDLPPSLKGNNNGGVPEVGSTITGNVNTAGSDIKNGTFYPANASAGAITITLDAVASVGFEFTVFGVDVMNDVQFASGSGQTIVSSNGNLKLNDNGSAAVAKYINTNTWALIGNLKA